MTHQLSREEKLRNCASTGQIQIEGMKICPIYGTGHMVWNSSLVGPHKAADIYSQWVRFNYCMFKPIHTFEDMLHGLDLTFLTPRFKKILSEGLVLG